MKKPTTLEELDRILAKSIADTDKSIQRTNKIVERTSKNIEESNKRLEKSIAETNKRLEKSIAETNRSIREEKESMKELKKVVEKTSRKVDRVAELYGGTANTLGRETEEKVFRFLENTKQLGKIKWDEVLSNFCIKNKLEIDLILINGTSIGVGEIKRKLTEQDIKKYDKKTLPNFKKYFPFSLDGKEICSIFACEIIDKEALEILKQKDCYLLKAGDKNFQVQQFPNYI